VLGDVLHEEANLSRSWPLVDHDIPCLAYAIEEESARHVAKERLAALGVSDGAWLREPKHAVSDRCTDETPIRVRCGIGRTSMS